MLHQMTISQKRLQGLRLKLQEYDSAENHTDNPVVCPIAVFLNSRDTGKHYVGSRKIFFRLAL